MQAPIPIIGVDVAQAELVVSAHAQGSSRPVPNDPVHIQRWLRTLPAGSVIAMESTGRYHRTLAQLAYEAGMQVYVLNARDIYYYAKAISARGKTDRLDAAVIARYVAEHREQLRPWQPAAGVTQQLQALLGRRQLLTDQRVMLRQSLGELPQLQQATQELLLAYQRMIEEIDRQMRCLVDSDATLREGVRRLGTITGFGAQASTLLAALFSRLHFDNADAVVAYSGLDPRPCDSGTRHGTRRLSKRGPALVRRLLFLAGFSAAHSKALGPIYVQLRARGFASTQATLILARKLLRVAWAVWNSGKDFDPRLVGAQQACQKT